MISIPACIRRAQISGRSPLAAHSALCGTAAEWRLAAPLAIASGGTAAATASAAFDNLKQDASTTATGVVELAIDAEVVTGTDTARAITPSNLGGAWTSYTCTLTPGGGAFVSTAGSAAQRTIGKTVQVSITRTITDVGTATTSVTLTVPVAPLRTLALVGTENGVTGRIIQTTVAAGATTSAILRDSTGATIVPATSQAFTFNTVYEAQ